MEFPPPAEAAEAFKQGSWDVASGLGKASGEVVELGSLGQQEPQERLSGSLQEPSTEQQPARLQGSWSFGRQARKLGGQRKEGQDKPGLQ